MMNCGMIKKKHNRKQVWVEMQKSQKPTQIRSGKGLGGGGDDDDDYYYSFDHGNRYKDTN